LWREISRGKVWKREIQNNSKNGKTYWVDTTIAPIYTHENKPNQFICISNLITERKIAEYELIKSLEKEKELTEFKNRLISMISHEFRTPLTGVQLATETLSRFSDKINPATKNKLLDNIKNSCERMDELIDDALIMNKSDSGKMKFEPENHDLKKFCNMILEEVNSLFTNHVKVQLNYLIEENNYFTFDLKLLRYIVINLLNNAIKYSDKGKDVEFHVSRERDNLVFLIKDYGIGIPENEKSKIFEPFHRAKNVGTRNGTGLGMAIAYKSTLMHGGKINFESNEGKGTTFKVNIPLVKVENP
ncbi:MAG: hypothetical protein KDK36_20010, partial [Leptospiraceae bacterium]|nr:hypothetical protein [Leptospiraceae bacterium]